MFTKYFYWALNKKKKDWFLILEKVFLNLKRILHWMDENFRRNWGYIFQREFICDKPLWTVRCWTHLTFFQMLLAEYGLRHGIHAFRPTWPCNIVKVLATLKEYLELCLLQHGQLLFHLLQNKFFGCFRIVKKQFEFIKHTFPN